MAVAPREFRRQNFLPPPFRGLLIIDLAVSLQYRNDARKLRVHTFAELSLLISRGPPLPHAGQGARIWFRSSVHCSLGNLAACSMEQRAFTSAKSINDIAALLFVRKPKPLSILPCSKVVLILE
jgi:hypothetical protein